MTGNRESLVHKQVTVLGLGIEGVDLVRYLAAQGASVTVSDLKSPEELSRRIQELDGLPVRFSLGANSQADITSADMVFVSQGVPLTLPALREARQRGVPLSSMTKLFLELCPAAVIGITGSSGKTTTTALVDAMFAACGRKHVVGGNIGVGLLGLLDQITPETWVVLEMSHTQLETVERSPHIACVLNVTPNHLDRYSWEEYTALKLRILQYQKRDDIAVLNLDDEVTCSFATEAPGQVIWFSSRRVPSGDSAFVREGWVILRRGFVETKLLPIDAIPLRGAHNVANVLAAVAVGGAVGLDFAAIEQAIRDFTPVPHRLELVDRIGGVAYYNDSIATTPERTMAGLASFHEPIVLLLGGREKNLPLEDLARQAIERCRAVVCFGEAGPPLEEALRSVAIPANGHAPPIQRVNTLEEAVDVGRGFARIGDVVLLSPACTSFDAYANFEERGEDFRRIVVRLAAKGGKEPSPLRRRAG
jgi:UDP-N-acetylmuramoylalanine--D-glutamate ligase